MNFTAQIGKRCFHGHIPDYSHTTDSILAAVCIRGISSCEVKYKVLDYTHFIRKKQPLELNSMHTEKRKTYLNSNRDSCPQVGTLICTSFPELVAMPNLWRALSFLPVMGDTQSGLEELFKGQMTGLYTQTTSPE